MCLRLSFAFLLIGYRGVELWDVIDPTVECLWRTLYPNVPKDKDVYIVTCGHQTGVFTDG